MSSRESWRRVPVVRVVTSGMSALRAWLAVRQRRAALARQQSVVVDLVAVAVGAGTSVLQALELASRWAPDAVAHEVTSMLRATQRGALLTDVLADHARRCPELRALTNALAVAMRTGAPISATLDRIAAECRTTQHRLALAQARTVSVRLIFPLVIFVLPAFALLTVIPALVAGWHGV